MEEKMTCRDCGKEFSTGEALEQHKQAKHIIKRKKIFRFSKMHVMIFLLIIILVPAYFLLASPKSTYIPLTDDADNFMGEANAPITIVEFSDFQCPACGRFFKETESEFIREYVDTGKVKFVYRHFPLTQIHMYAQKAAEAAECAADQGKFWKYHNKLFENQKALFTNSLKGYASDIGLNRTSFDACLDSGVMSTRVYSDITDGQQRGVQSTPTFFVNGKQVKGAQSYMSFKRIIDSELRKS